MTLSANPFLAAKSLAVILCNASEAGGETGFLPWQDAWKSDQADERGCSQLKDALKISVQGEDVNGWRPRIARTPIRRSPWLSFSALRNSSVI